MLFLSCHKLQMAKRDLTFISSDRGGSYYNTTLEADTDYAEILNISKVNTFSLQTEWLVVDEIKVYASLKETPAIAWDWDQLTNCSSINPIADGEIIIDNVSAYRHLKVEKVGALDPSILCMFKLI